VHDPSAGDKDSWYVRHAPVNRPHADTRHHLELLQPKSAIDPGDVLHSDLVINVKHYPNRLFNHFEAFQPRGTVSRTTGEELFTDGVKSVHPQALIFPRESVSGQEWGGFESVCAKFGEFQETKLRLLTTELTTVTFAKDVAESSMFKCLYVQISMFVNLHEM
jgi:hypothetical protein